MLGRPPGLWYPGVSMRLLVILAMDGWMPILSLFILNAFAAWMYRSAAVWYLSSLPLLKKLKPPPALCSVFSACDRGTCQRAVVHVALVRGWRGVAGEPTFWIRLRGSSAMIAGSVCGFVVGRSSCRRSSSIESRKIGFGWLPRGSKCL